MHSYSVHSPLLCDYDYVYMQMNNLIGIKIAFISNSRNNIVNSCHVNKLLVYICIFFKRKGN